MRHRLAVLADAAKYDASCASSGSKRQAASGGLGNTEGMGICHSDTPDGRCVSLLKLLLTNLCVYDCQYCVNRTSSDVERARFTPEEVVELTLEFYRRNYSIASGILQAKHEGGRLASLDVERAPRTEDGSIVARPERSFAPAGQSTQIIVGATATSDRLILATASTLYDKHKLRRV